MKTEDFNNRNNVEAFEIGVDENLDIWDRDSGYTFGGSKGWWATGTTKIGNLSSMWSTNKFNSHSTAQRLLKHRNHIDSLCKVVDPTVKHTLEFASANGSGYSDMTRGHIVIDGKLIQKNSNKLDVVSGLAIHEKLHVIHSVPLHEWQRSQEAYDMANTYAEKKLLHSVANIIEDEYIERQLHKTCAGYVQYIEACKEHYFAESKIENIDLNDFTEIIHTLLLLVRYPAKLDADRRRKHGKHIRVFMSELKRSIDSRDNTITSIKKIYNYLIKLAEETTSEEGITDEMMFDLENKASYFANNYIEDFKEDISPEAWAEMVADGKIKEMRTEVYERRLADLIYDEEYKFKDKLGRLLGDEYIDALDKATNYEADKLSSMMANQIKKLHDSSYTEEMLEEGLAVTKGQRKISWEIAPINEHATRNYIDAKKKMRAQISKLKKKIQLFGATNIHNIYRQPKGTLDKRQLHRIPMGMTDIFKAKITEEDKPLDVCLLVDESGSMVYNMENARNCAVAIKEALADNPMIDLWVYGHSADEKEVGQTEMIEYYSPSMTDRPMVMGGLNARYENRDGNAIITSALRIKRESQNNANKLMIVLSDGQPSADLYRGKIGIDHTKRAVEYVENYGWNVVQVGFGGISEHQMKQMFTNYIHVENTEELSEKVSKIIRKVVGI